MKAPQMRGFFCGLSRCSPGLFTHHGYHSWLPLETGTPTFVLTDRNGTQRIVDPTTLKLQ